MKTILIIIDDTKIRENIYKILVTRGYKVISAANGKIGLALAKEKKPDIILCDIILPGLEGYRVFNGLKGDFETSDIPFIFFVPKLKKNEVESKQDIVANGYIREPFEANELFDTIERTLK